MLDQQGSTVRSVAWSELLPWLCIFRCLQIALRPTMLVLATTAALLTAAGWTVLDRGFGRLEGKGVNPVAALTSVVPEHPGLPLQASGRTGSESLLDQPAGPLGDSTEPVYGSWERLSRPWRAIFAEGRSWSGLFWLGLCGIWTIVVWGFFGAAMTRMAAVELAAEERIGLGAVLRFAQAKWLSFLAAPAVSLTIVAVITVLLTVAAFVLQIFPPLWGLLWGLFLVGGGVMASLLLGLLLGWPLMWPTIATEGTDGFDAWSRAHSYLLERPLHYLFYMVVAFLFGLLSWLLVANLAAATIHLSFWAAHWGVSTAMIESLRAGHGISGWLVSVWTGIVKLLAVGFLFSYFWSASTAVYLLMRQKVDAAEMDEIALEEDQEEPYGLPPLKTDAAGVPLVDDEE